MNKKQTEILKILVEECAEVIQAVSKCDRFGIDTVHLKEGVPNRAHLTEELGDLLCMIQLAAAYNVVDMQQVELAAVAKQIKLKQWSNIFQE
jgi:NTP pyrophosphatase (non-canonical NTP hydrolase)